MNFLPGWIPDLPDFRDVKYKSKSKVSALPPLVDLRSQDVPVYDQGSIGSCTGCAISGMYHFVDKKYLNKFTPSPLFTYYGARTLGGNENKDSGSSIRNGMKFISKSGVCSETTWPYDVSKVTKKPTKEAYKEALNHQAIQYQRIDDKLNAMKQCLFEGFPFVFGFTMYESFTSKEVWKTGIVPMPSKSEKNLGGHSVMAVGYDESKRVMIVRNSWGKGWGDKGYFYMPYDYMRDSNLAADFWTIRKVEI